MIDGCVTALCSDFPSERLPLFCCGADVSRPEVTFSCCQFLFFFCLSLSPDSLKNSKMSLNLLPIASFQVSFHMIVFSRDNDTRFCRMLEMHLNNLNNEDT